MATIRIPKRRPFVSRAAYVPLELLAHGEAAKLIKHCDIKYVVRDMNGRPAETIQLPLANVRNGWLRLPRAFGVEYLRDHEITFDDRTTFSFNNDALFPRQVKPRDPQQSEFMDAIKAQILRPGPVDFSVSAKTGSGKTVALIHAAAALGISPVLVIVHTNTLKNQWIGSIEKKNGFRFFMGNEFADNIGILQQARPYNPGHTVTVGLLPSLSMRDYPSWVYDYFSMVILDEVHVSPTPVLHNALDLFSARVRIGLSATHREGQQGKLIRLALGPVKVESKQEVFQPTVFRVKYCPDEPQRINTYSKPSIITSLTRLPARQALLAKIIRKYVQHGGRICVVLSERVAQLEDLRDRAIDYGMDPELIGMYVGEYEPGTFEWALQLSTGGYKVSKEKFGCKRECRAALKLEVERLESQDKTVAEKSVRLYAHKPSPAELDLMAANCSLFLATYRIFGTGTDIARIDMGIEASPVADARQAIGRVVREAPGKLQPVWFTIEDEIFITDRNDPFSEDKPITSLIDMTTRRRGSYKFQNAIIKRVIQK